MRILFSWLGMTDLRLAGSNFVEGDGPILSHLKRFKIEELVLLTDKAHDQKKIETFKNAIHKHIDVTIEDFSAKINDPTDIGLIYEHSLKCISNYQISKEIKQADYFYNLSSGTWAHAAAWILINNNQISGTPIQSSPEKGSKEVKIPFKIKATQIAKIIKDNQPSLSYLKDKLSGTLLYGVNIQRNTEQHEFITRIHKAALSSAPILIEGDPGTEKDETALAIHHFGRDEEKSGDISITNGYFKINCLLFDEQEFLEKINEIVNISQDEATLNTTILIKEVDTLSEKSQLALFNFIEYYQEKNLLQPKIRWLFTSKSILINEMKSGNFREDLFFKISTLTLKVPSLLARKSDLANISKDIVKEINLDNKSSEKYTLTKNAVNSLINSDWPGNMLELKSTLRRAVFQAKSNRVSESDIYTSYFHSSRDNATARHLKEFSKENPLDLKEEINKLANHYINDAYSKTNNNSVEAAKLLSLPNYQTLLYWSRKKYKEKKN